MTERTAYRLHTLKYRDDDSAGFECCHLPITCQFPKCDCDPIRGQEEAERQAEERRQLENEERQRLENEAMAEHFRKHPHG